jgi:hypothetical protein
VVPVAKETAPAKERLNMENMRKISAFILHDTGTWDQPSVWVPAGASGAAIVWNLERVYGGLMVQGLQDDPEAPDDINVLDWCELPEDQSFDVWAEHNMADEDRLVKADGYDAACLGIVETFEPTTGGGATRRKRLLYDIDHMADILVARDGMTAEEAYEHLEYNVKGSYVGPSMPAFLIVKR